MNAGSWLADRAHTVAQTRSHHPQPLYRDQLVFDLRDESTCREAVRACKPDVIVHAAAIAGHLTSANDPDQAYAVNVSSTDVLSSEAQRIGSRFIYISTDAVFSGDSGNYSETDEPDPFSIYGETKLRGEQAAIRNCENSLVVRTNFFGWSGSGDRSVLEFFVNALRRGESVGGYPDVVVTSIYVTTLLEIIWRLAERETAGIVHVASCDSKSKYEFGKAVAEEFALDGALISLEIARDRDETNARQRNLSLDTSRLRDLLQEKPESQVQGIRKARVWENSIRRSFSEGGVRAESK